MVIVVVVIMVIVVVGIVLAVMIMGIVGLQGAHHIEEVVIILLCTLLMVEDPGGTDPGRCLIPLMVAQEGGTHVVLGDAICYFFMCSLKELMKL